MKFCYVRTRRRDVQSRLTAAQEVDAYEGGWRAVKGVACEIRGLVDATLEQCDEMGKGPGAVSKALVDPLAKLQECVNEPMTWFD